MVDTPSQPIANPLATNNAPRVLVRTNLNEFDPLSYLTQVNQNNALYNASLNPQTPERSWTQGLARMLQSAVSGFNQGKLNNQLADYKSGKSSDLAILGDYLTKGGDFKQVLSSMKNPEDQGLALQFAQALAMKGAEFQNQLAAKKYQSDLDINKEQEKAKASPQAQTEVQLASVNNDLAKLQLLASHETDPSRKQALSEQITNMGNTRDQMLQQIQMEKGTVPDQTVIAKNNAMSALARGVKPSDLPQDQQIALAGNSYLDSIKKLNDATDKDVEEINQGFKSARNMHDQGQIILQELAANPNITSGPGVETYTKFKTLINNLAPGTFADNASQQTFQNDINKLSATPLGQLHANGLQRITQYEFQNIVKAMVPSLANSTEGIKMILELQDALYGPQQNAQEAINKINATAATNPFFNKADAINDVRNALSKESEKAGMSYLNQKLEAQGKQLAINPQYDPNVGGVNKYMIAPLQKPAGPAALPTSNPTTQPPVAPLTPTTQPPVAPLAPPTQPPRVPMPPPQQPPIQPQAPNQVANGLPIAQPGMLPPLPQSPVTPITQPQVKQNPVLQLAQNNPYGDLVA